MLGWQHRLDRPTTGISISLPNLEGLKPRLNKCLRERMPKKTYWGPWSKNGHEKETGYLNPLVKEKYKTNKSYGHKK